MLIATLLALSLLAFFAPRLWRYRLKPWFAKAELRRLLARSPQGKEMQYHAAFLSKLYKGVHGNLISQLDRKRLKLSDDSYVYGEIEFLSFLYLLEKVNPQKGEVFYDLGSGTGKPVFAAGLSYDFGKACGIELLPALCKKANKQLERVEKLIKNINPEAQALYQQRLKTICFTQGNFLDLDFLDADLLFINATCLNYYAWQALLLRFNDLKAGSRLIITTKKIEDPLFEALYQGVELMSWGLNSVNIYRKTR